MRAEALRHSKPYRTLSAVLPVLAVLTLGSFLYPVPAAGQSSEATKKAEEKAAEIKNQFDRGLSETKVEVKVEPLPQGQFWVVLTGRVETEREKALLERLAEEIKPENVLLDSRLTTPLPGDGEETHLWSLTYYLSSRLPGEDPATSPSRSQRVTELANTLNALYGTPQRPVVFLAGGGALLLRGKKEQVQRIKSFLAQLDSPWPQVQMTLWALQVSGSREQIADQIDRINFQVRSTRDDILEVQRELEKIAREGGLHGCAATLYETILCRKSPVFLPVSSPLSLNESLIHLIVHADRQGKVATLSDWVEQRFPEQVAQARERLDPKHRARYRPFHRLEEVLHWRSKEADCVAFQYFLRALQANEPGRQQEGAPEAVIRTGTILDRVLKAAMDAYVADMSELFFDPLLSHLQDGVAAGQGKDKRKGDGVALIGRSRIVVTSGLTSGLKPDVSSSVQTSRPKPFGEDLLDRAFPAKEAGDPELTGADRILASLPEGQALLLAAALSEPEPQFSRVAPGVEVKIRPTVLPDGAAARLTIDARFGVTTTPLDPAAGADTWEEPPAAAIQSHRVETDATVGVFDLFDVSSFSMTTSHPQAPWSLPVLGRLPILGRAFQWPRGPKVAHHESLILVNTVVLPRAVNLSSFYRRWDFESPSVPGNCTPGGAVASGSSANP